MNQGSVIERVLEAERLRAAAVVARDIVAFNAGASICVAGLANSLADGVKLALATLASGAARNKLDQFVAHTSTAAKSL